MKKKLSMLISSAEFLAEAAKGNPSLGWLKFVLTDDQPNSKNQGIKTSCFPNLVDSGILMPLKVAKGGIKLDHTDAEPLGAIASLDVNEHTIIGKAAVWKEERPEDYNMLKEMSSNGEPINISWEIMYTDSSTEENVEWLNDPVLTAATIVGSPAYGGRTPVLSIASVDPPKEPPAPPAPVPPAPAPPPPAPVAPTPTAPNPEIEKELKELREYREHREAEDTKAARLDKRVLDLKQAGFDFSAEEIESDKTLWQDIDDGTFASLVGVMSRIQKTSINIPSVPDVSGNVGDGDVIKTVRDGLKKMKEEK